MTDIKALLREAAMFLRCYADTVNAGFELADQLDAAAESLGEPEWKPIESYDAMRSKPAALFYVAPELNATRPYLNLRSTIVTNRHMGSRTTTHWMPLPEPPAGDSHE